MFGMHLPCYVVITKSDIMPGFREYFANIDDNIRKAPLGWKSSKPYYEDYEFSSFWVEFINNLRKGRNSILLNSDVFYPSMFPRRVLRAAAVWSRSYHLIPASSRITSPAIISPATGGTKAMLPGMERRAPGSSPIVLPEVSTGFSFEKSTFS